MRRVLLVVLLVLLVGVGGFLAVGLATSTKQAATSSGTPVILPTDSTTIVVTPSATPTPTPSATSTAPQQTGEANPSPFVTPTVPDPNAPKPTCSSVWVDGGTLPATYHGCTGDSKADEHMLDCNSGPKLWIRNEPNSYEYYAFAGKQINHTKDPNADSAATGKCMS